MAISRLTGMLYLGLIHLHLYYIVKSIKYEDQGNLMIVGASLCNSLL